MVVWHLITPSDQIRIAIGLALCLALILSGCGDKRIDERDRPRLNSHVVLRDVSFHSAALAREMRYRVIMPASIGLNQKLPVTYLLHGNGGGFRDWSNYSDVARYAESGLVLVMPQGDLSYYLSAVERPGDRYEDYIVRDLLADAESKFPIAQGRSNRAIAGVSMGGFGAIKIAFSHPELFIFVGALSPPIDAPRRRFSIKRFQQYRAMSAIFGPWGSEARRKCDPFLLARSVNADDAPYLFLSCGEGESLLAVNREFSEVFARRHRPYEFHVLPGGHDWNQWSAQLPGLFEQLLRHVHS